MKAVRAIVPKHKVGALVRLNEAGLENENYSDFYDSILRITHVATKYTPAAKFFEQNKPDGFHPGFDEGADAALYDLETEDGAPVPFSLYEWEVEATQ